MLQYLYSTAVYDKKSLMKENHSAFFYYARSVFIGVLAGLGLAITFAAGFLVHDVIEPPAVLADTPPEQADTTMVVGYPLIDEVQSLLDRVYLREQPDYSVRQYEAIRGMLGSLEDPNTFFIEPPVARSEADTLAGTYGGIGVQLSRNTAGDYVLYPFTESPAAIAGVEDGAILVAINSVPIDPSTQQDAVDQQMRGEVTDGNGVELTVRQNEGELTFFIEFDVINVPSVVSRILEEDTRIGYVQIIRFTNRTPDELREALTNLNNQQITALVVDLRNNSGGLLEESVTVASEFLDGGVVVYELDAEGERTLDAEAGGLAIEQPLVVLVNHRTASASELVAGAIRDRDRGILIGQTTFGKGTVQQIFSLSDGSSVHITSAEWLTPNRTALAGVGLEPTITMIPDENGRDIEIGEAIRYLQHEYLDSP